MKKAGKVLLGIYSVVMTAPAVAGVTFAVQNPNTTINWFKGENADQKISSAWSDYLQAKEDLDFAQSLVEEMKNSQKTDKALIAQLEQNLTKAQENLAKAQEELQKVTTEKNQQITALQSELGEAQEQLSTATQELTILREQHAEDTEAITQKESEISNLQSTITQKESEIENFQNSLTQKEQEIQLLNTQMQELQTQFTNILEEVNFIKNLPINFVSFENSSLENIVQAAEQIAAQKMTSEQVFKTYGWRVGDERTITTQDDVIRVRILGYNHDDKSDGSGKAGITLGVMRWTNKYRDTITSKADSYTWETCNLREDLFSVLDNLLPSKLGNAIKTVNKKTAMSRTSDEITITQDKFFLFSQKEIMGTNYNTETMITTPEGEGEQYEYYKNAPIPTIVSGSGELIPIEGNSGTYLARAEEGSEITIKNRYGKLITLFSTGYYNFNSFEYCGMNDFNDIFESYHYEDTNWYLRSLYRSKNGGNFICTMSEDGNIGGTGTSGNGLVFGFCI